MWIYDLQVVNTVNLVPTLELDPYKHEILEFCWSGRTIFGRRAFTVAGPTAWNSLPDYLRDPSLSEDTFRRLLKTYLFALY